ncbi:MAG: hypothetical protein IKW80_07855, partial [Thermoguttaceae bacterium]|nr:hypothetical protein [Thermoguttaceae bacterium]
MNYPTEPLAIIGAHCCVPGAFSPEEFWQNLSQGKVSLTTLPNERYPFDVYRSEQSGVFGKSHVNLVCPVDLYEFNRRYKPDFVKELIAGGTPSEVIPTELAMLMASFSAYHAIKSAGYDPFNLPQVPFGVYSGMDRLSDGFSNFLMRQALPYWIQLLGQSSPELSSQTLNS